MRRFSRPLYVWRLARSYMFIDVHSAYTSSVFYLRKYSTKVSADIIRGTGGFVFLFIGVICHNFSMMVEFSYRTLRIMDGIIFGRQSQESTLRQVADAMVKTGLRDLGYQHLEFLRCFWRDVESGCYGQWPGKKTCRSFDPCHLWPQSTLASCGVEPGSSVLYSRQILTPKESRMTCSSKSLANSQL